MRRMMPGLPIILSVLVSAAVGAQTPAPPAQAGVQQGVKVGKVYVSGENPVIRLLDKEGGTPLVVASFWRIIWSPVGAGHVCYITTGDGKSPDDLRIALVDNQKLFEFLTNEVLGSYDKTYHDRPFKTVQATFGSSGDTASEWQERCTSDQYKVELAWRDLYPPFQLDTPAGGSPNPFGITSLFIPAKSADVIVNGRKLAGGVYPQMRGPAQSSSAFLAFSESWIK